MEAGEELTRCTAQPAAAHLRSQHSLAAPGSLTLLPRSADRILPSPGSPLSRCLLHAPEEHFCYQQGHAAVKADKISSTYKYLLERGNLKSSTTQNIVRALWSLRCSNTQQSPPQTPPGLLQARSPEPWDCLHSAPRTLNPFICPYVASSLQISSLRNPIFIKPSPVFPHKSR